MFTRFPGSKLFLSCLDRFVVRRQHILTYVQPPHAHKALTQLVHVVGIENVLAPLFLIAEEMFENARPGKDFLNFLATGKL
jgi:hypothetical protein